MASAAWMDAETMIRSNAITAYHLDGMEDEDDSILNVFETADKRSPPGASLRWAIVVGDDGQMAAMFQGLTLGEPSITSKPQLRGDGPAVINVASFPMWSRSFDGEAAAGPVPIIACRQEDQQGLTDNPLAMHKEIQKLAGVLGMPELLSYREAVAYTKKVRGVRTASEAGVTNNTLIRDGHYPPEQNTHCP